MKKEILITALRAAAINAQFMRSFESGVTIKPSTLFCFRLLDELKIDRHSFLSKVVVHVEYENKDNVVVFKMKEKPFGPVAVIGLHAINGTPFAALREFDTYIERIDYDKLSDESIQKAIADVGNFFKGFIEHKIVFNSMI